MRARAGLRWSAAAVVAASLFVSCSPGDKKSEARKPMTEHQRDSTIAASGLPGAGAVGKALQVADSARVRANRSIPESN